MTGYRLYIDGGYVKAEDGRTFETTNSREGMVWAQIAHASAADMDRALAAAKAARRVSWAQCSGNDVLREYLQPKSTWIATEISVSTPFVIR